MRAIYEVEVVDRATGDERWVEVEADGQRAAQESLVKLGETVGSVRLARVVASTQPVAVSGMTTCPKCFGTTWRTDRSIWFLLGLVIFFPLSLLVLMMPQRYKCLGCGHEILSKNPPTTSAPRGRSVMALARLGSLVLIFIILLWFFSRA